MQNVVEISISIPRRALSSFQSQVLLPYAPISCTLSILSLSNMSYKLSFLLGLLSASQLAAVNADPGSRHYARWDRARLAVRQTIWANTTTASSSTSQVPSSSQLPPETTTGSQTSSQSSSADETLVTETISGSIITATVSRPSPTCLDCAY